jgi:hypothetical protein
MAPEAISNNTAELQGNPFACDVFSFAVMAWHILAGDRPYVQSRSCEGMSLHQIQQRVVEGHRPEITQGSRFPDGMVGLLNRCWAPRPNDRPTFAAVVTSIRGLEGAFAC